MSILAILNEIAEEASTNNKEKILTKYENNQLLRRVIYLAKSKRIKFYIKKIPDYIIDPTYNTNLEKVLDFLSEELATRKVTGNNAINDLISVLESLSIEDALVVEKIIKKDLKIGMGTTTINKVLGKNFIEKTPYMGATPFSEEIAQNIVDSNDGAISQIKMDGTYRNAIVTGGPVQLESRGGEPSYLYTAKFLKELEIFDDFDGVLNGELTMDGVPRYASNGIVASCSSIGKKIYEGKNVHAELVKFKKKHLMEFEQALDAIRLTVWDVITTEEYSDNVSLRPYDERFSDLNQLIRDYNPTMISVVESLYVEDYVHAVQHFQKALVDGEEGTILKAMDGTWKHGKPKWQCKMKLEMDLDLEIVSYNYGKEGTKNEHVYSSINVKSSDGILRTSPGGMSEDDMEYTTEHANELIGKIVKIKCSGLSQDRDGNYSLLHPVFIEHRDDKIVSDSIEDIIKIENMKKGLE